MNYYIQKLFLETIMEISSCSSSSSSSNSSSSSSSSSLFKEGFIITYTKAVYLQHTRKELEKQNTCY